MKFRRNPTSFTRVIYENPWGVHSTPPTSARVKVCALRVACVSHELSLLARNIETARSLKNKSEKKISSLREKLQDPMRSYLSDDELKRRQEEEARQLAEEKAYEQAMHQAPEDDDIEAKIKAMHAHHPSEPSNDNKPQ